MTDLAEPDADPKKKAATPLQRFLASAWCSPTLICDTASWRGVGGRRVLLPYTVYKAKSCEELLRAITLMKRALESSLRALFLVKEVYRQLRSAELDLLRRAALDCIIMQANSPQASLRKTAMRALSELVDMDISVLTLRLRLKSSMSFNDSTARPVEETVDMRLRDESSWVRQAALIHFALLSMNLLPSRSFQFISVI